jgi:hypothetical protein
MHRRPRTGRLFSLPFKGRAGEGMVFLPGDADIHTIPTQPSP